MSSAVSTHAATRGFLLAALAIAAVLTILGSSKSAAHARLEASTPAPGSALATAPTEISLRFTEPIDAAYSTASLLASDGQEFPTGAVRTAPDDDHTALVSINDPASLPVGNYTLVFRVLSAADGHFTDGVLSFSVGTGQVPAGVTTIDDEEPLPQWAIAASWLEVAGLIVVFGVFPFGLFVALPALRQDTERSRLLQRTLRQIWIVGFLLAIAGMVAVLVIQIGRTTDGSLVAWPGFDAVLDLLFDTRFGVCWIARIIALFVSIPLAIMSVGVALSGRPFAWLAGIVVGAIALVTVPLSGHAAAVDAMWEAVATDWLHLAMVTVWLGGLVYLVGSLFRLSTLADDESVLSSAVMARRFSTMALIALALVIASGILNAIFDVSGPRNLTTATYGQTLIVKHLIVIPILIAAGVNLLVTIPRIRRTLEAGRPEATRRFLKALKVTTAAELIFAVAVLVAAAALTELAPADGPLQVKVAAKTATYSEHSAAGDLDVWLLGTITGEPGDRFTLTVSNVEGDPPDDILRVIVRSTAATSSGEIGDRFDAEQLTGNPGTFVFPASRLGLSANWQLEVTVRRAGIPDEIAGFTVDTQGTGLQPPRFVADEWRLPRMTPIAWFTLSLAIVAIIGGVIGVKKLPGLEPLAAALFLTMVALIAAGFLVTSYRLSIPVSASTNVESPVPPDDASITRGEALYRTSCVTCHGATGGGPNEQTIADDPSHDHGANADLLTRRARGKRDGDLYHAITSGVPGTEMPAYDYALTEQDRWDLVNYLRKLQDEGV